VADQGRRDKDATRVDETRQKGYDWGMGFNRSIQFRDDVNDRLSAAAERMHVSVNWLVNQLCDEGLERIIPELKVTVER